MTLRELEAEFIRYDRSPEGREVYTYIESLAEAQGIVFLCPLCFGKNNGPVGTHSVVISFDGKGVPEDQGSHNSSGQPFRWSIIGGTGLDDLQLSPSIHLDTSTCKWHGFVGNSSGVPPGHAQ